MAPSHFEATDPARWFARKGLRLSARRDVLRLPGRTVWGVWDPSIRRVTLFGCDESRSDAELLHTLGHELWHVMRHRRGDDGSSDAAADVFAARFIARLGPARVAACAVVLRAMARSGN